MSVRASVIRSLLWALGHVPLPLNHATGVVLGWLAAIVPSRPRRVAETNLTVCFPALDAPARRRLLRRGLAETGKTASEAGLLWHAPVGRVLGWVRAVSGEAAVDAARGQGRGVVFAAPHLGAWELVGLYLGHRHAPITSLYRPPREAALDGYMRRARERTGARLVPTGPQGIRALYRALEHGEAVGILPDQEPKQGTGTFAPFFGVAAHTMVLIPRLARRCGAPVFVVYAERLGWGRGYHLHFEPAGAAVADEDPEVAAAALNQAVEACVRRLPSQYQWTYKRFARRPPGLPPVYGPKGGLAWEQVQPR